MSAPHRHTILVIDDDKSMTLLVAATLRPVGYNVLMAMDPVQGYRMVQQDKPSLVLLDLQMPAGGGLQLLDRLLGSTKTHAIPVVIMSAMPASEKAAELAAHGAVGYLEKPLDGDLLLRTVRSALGADFPPRLMASGSVPRRYSRGGPLPPEGRLPRPARYLACDGAFAFLDAPGGPG